LIDLNFRTCLILSILLFPFFAFNQVNSNYSLKILGVVQDGGLPHLGNNKTCCENIQQNKYVTSIMLVNNENNESYLFDASPDINEQLNFMGDRIKTDLKGIFLTHAHIGHYTGLMYFGREALNSKSINVYAMPRMKRFLEDNGPWSQLVSLKNILIKEINNNSKLSVDPYIIIQPIEVPHRAEFSETVGYRIVSQNKSLVYIPDIDKWSKWDQDLFKVVLHTDYALLDGTFYSSNEIPHRDMSEIPHPFIIETMDLLNDMNSKNRKKIYFIHFNHSNPAINHTSSTSNIIRSKRFNVAKEGLILKL